MKKIIFLLILFQFSIASGYAQILISTNVRQDGKFDPVKKEYIPVAKDKVESTYFDFDEDFTMFRHITPAKTSVYLIKSTKKDEANFRWEFDVMSDAGYSYYLIIDIINKNLRFIYKEKNTTYLAQFAINKYWVDK